MQIPVEQATLALRTVAVVLPAHDDPRFVADEIDLPISATPTPPPLPLYPSVHAELPHDASS